MTTLATLLVGAALWSFGLGLTALATRLVGVRPRSRVERLAFGLAVGVAAGTALWTGVVAVAGPLEDGTGRLLLIALGVAGLPGLASLRHPGPALAPERWRPLQGVLAAACAWFLGFALVYSATLPMHLFDPVYHFAYKGKLVHQEGFGTESWMVLAPELEEHRSIGRPITHPNYPPGLPTLHAMVANAGGAFDEDATRPLMGLFVLIAAGALWTALRPRGRSPALLGVLMLASLPLLYYSQLPYNYFTWEVVEARFTDSFAFHPLELLRSAAGLVYWGDIGRPGWRMPDGWTLDGAADLPLAALLVAGAVLLWRCLPGSGLPSDRADALLAGVCLGGATLAKNEGLALAALTFAVFGAVAALRRAVAPSVPTPDARPWRALLLAGVVAGAVAAPWLAIRGAIPSIDEDYPRALAALVGAGEPPPGAGVTNQTPTTIREAAARIPVVALGFGYSAAHLLRWNLTWILFAVALAWWALRRPVALVRHPALPLAGLVVGTLGAYAVILLVTPWDLAHLYTTTIPGRLILHVAPLAILVTLTLAYTTADERRGVPAPEDAP